MHAHAPVFGPHFHPLAIPGLEHANREFRHHLSLRVPVDANMAIPVEMLEDALRPRELRSLRVPLLSFLTPFCPWLPFLQASLARAQSTSS